jgi:hypothetical protein
MMHTWHALNALVNKKEEPGKADTEFLTTASS